MLKLLHGKQQETIFFPHGLGYVSILLRKKVDGQKNGVQTHPSSAI
jgi:hypothetical protein